MRKNLLAAWAAFNRHEATGGKSISSKRGPGWHLMIHSYSTPILTDCAGCLECMAGSKMEGTRWEEWRNASGESRYLNAEHYSNTTTSQQNALRVLLAREGFSRVKYAQKIVPGL